MLNTESLVRHATESGFHLPIMIEFISERRRRTTKNLVGAYSQQKL